MGPQSSAPDRLGAAWSGDCAAFLRLPQDEAGALLAARSPGGFGRSAARWGEGTAMLQAALGAVPEASGWQMALDFALLRVDRRVDAVIATGRAVVALTLRPGAIRFAAADRLAAEDAALDLHGFHAGCTGVPVLPVLVADGARPSPVRPLPLPGPAPVLEANRRTLPALMEEVAALPPAPGGAPAQDWIGAAYRPIPSLIDAACLLYARHGGTVLGAAAGRASLGETRHAIQDALRQARALRRRTVVFVTGAPGAGKTLCGLDAVLAQPDDSSGGAAFLTGNPTLVHVLREALARQAAASLGLRAARQRMRSVIQALPAFRDHYLARGDAPAEPVAVVDEAQRCWTRHHAAGRAGLPDSEPGCLLDVMARVPGWSALVCLVGGGQEIHDGEGGLAAWGDALARRPDWHAIAAPAALHHADPRRALSGVPHLIEAPALHLEAAMRSLRGPVPAWVDRVLAGDPDGAASLAIESGGIPITLTRDLPVLRATLRAVCRGERRSGLVRSSGAARLRAEGLGAVLPHQDDSAVARWFLDRWPDIRAAGALEVAATEFAVQGLELDHVGLCWDGDLVRRPGHDHGWQVRDLRGTRWTLPRTPERVQNRLNAYRVLLTRAREHTVIWVPRGDAADATRDPRLLDGIADYLTACGATPLQDAPSPPEPPCALPSLL